MINCKRCRHNPLQPVKITYQYLPRGTEKNHQKPQDNQCRAKYWCKQEARVIKSQLQPSVIVTLLALNIKVNLILFIFKLNSTNSLQFHVIFTVQFCRTVTVLTNCKYAFWYMDHLSKVYLVSLRLNDCTVLSYDFQGQSFSVWLMDKVKTLFWNIIFYKTFHFYLVLLLKWIVWCVPLLQFFSFIMGYEGQK